MNQFYKLNKSKILKSLKFLSLTGIAFVSVILLIAFFNNQLPSEILLGKIFITAGIIFPFFGLTIAYLDWESRNLLKNKKFNKNPLNQLQKIGFKDSYLNQDNKWHFTEKIKKSVIKDYTIEANIEREKSKFIKFSHKIDFSIYNSSMLIKAIDNLEKNGIYLENKRIIKRIRINNIKTVGYLENELIRFVDELKKNKIAPDKKR